MILLLRALHVLTLLSAFAATAVFLLRLPSAERVARVVLPMGAAAGVAGLAVRTAMIGHLPIFGTLENTWTCSTVLLATAAAASLRGGRLGGQARLLPPWAVVFLLWGFRYRFEPVPLTISEQSVFVDIHVLFAWAGFVALLWAGSVSAMLLFRGRARDREQDGLVARLLSVGYVFLTAMILAGAWYLFVLFGTFWRWDVVGVTALITWLGYSVVLHGWLLHRWRRLLHVASAGLLVPLLLLFWVWSVFPGTYHFFDIPLMLPY